MTRLRSSDDSSRLRTTRGAEDGGGGDARVSPIASDTKTPLREVNRVCLSRTVWLEIKIFLAAESTNATFSRKFSSEPGKASLGMSRYLWEILCRVKEYVDSHSCTVKVCCVIIVTGYAVCSFGRTSSIFHFHARDPFVQLLTFVETF